MAVSLALEHALGDPVMGIDEAGRGPLAGGVYAAAVSVPLAQADALLDGAWAEINDSKKLTERARARLAEVVKSTPGCTWAVASASPAEIDRLNILYATHLSARQTVAFVSSSTALSLRRMAATESRGRSTQERSMRLPMAVPVLSSTQRRLPFFSPLLRDSVSSRLRRAV